MTITNKVTLKSLNTGLTPATDVPDAPIIGTATAGAGSASVTFTAAATGGTPTSYTVTSSPGSLTGTGASSPITVSGLTVGTSYTFTVTATNSAGTSPASSASNSATPFNPLGYESIATVSLTGNSSTVSFTSIPSTYTHLQIRAIARSNRSGNPNDMLMTINSDTGSNYSWHGLYGNGTSASSDANASQPNIHVMRNNLPSANSTASIFGALVIDILDYANTNKYKTIRVLTGGDFNGSGTVGIMSGNWRNTNAITSLTFQEETTASLVQYTHFALYGIKG